MTDTDTIEYRIRELGKAAPRDTFNPNLVMIGPDGKSKHLPITPAEYARVVEALTTEPGSTYRLIITRPDGTEFQSDTEPFTSRKVVSYDALRHAGVMPKEASGDDEEFRRQVECAPLGVAVAHEPSGYRFTVKEF